MKHYYDFGYFFNRKDSGSIKITLTKQLDTDDTDECIKYALTHGLLKPEYADNIIYVEELNKDEAKNMGFDMI